MPRGVKKEKMRERNDSLVIVKADGGLVEADDVYQEFGELHSDTDGATIDIQHKIPVFRPTVLGRPPIQDKMIYYVDAEPEDAGFDPNFIFGKLKSAHNLSVAKGTLEAEKERKHRRNMDLIFVASGVFLLIFALFLAPAMGFSLRTDGGAGGNRRPPPVDETAPPPPLENRIIPKEVPYAG